jgi:hypothetical protein
MMLPIAAPARMPAPTAQPTHSAFAGAGAIMAATPMPAAPITAMRDLCMCSFSETTQVTTTEDSTRLYSKGYRTVYSAMKIGFEQLRQLSDVHRNPPRLVAGRPALSFWHDPATRPFASALGLLHSKG